MLREKRPVFLNPFQLHLPVTGWVSILHRLSGALLFLLLPFMVWGFALVQTSEADFFRVMAYLKLPIAKLLILVGVAALAQHFFAGLRHLAMDMHWGMSLKIARRSSLIVMLATGGVTLLAAWVLYR